MRIREGEIERILISSGEIRRKKCERVARYSAKLPRLSRANLICINCDGIKGNVCNCARAWLIVNTKEDIVFFVLLLLGKIVTIFRNIRFSVC